MMELEKTFEQILKHQLDNLFLTEYQKDNSRLKLLMTKAISNTERCVLSFKSKSSNKKDIVISPLHSTEYCIFLYWMSRYAYLQKDIELASQIYYLNKALNSVELFYEVEMPEIWACEHPLGSVMGKAMYGNHFYFYQGCTVGGNFRIDGSVIYPRFKSHVIMLSNSKIIGNCKIGSNVVISANAYIKDLDVPDNVIVFGQSPNIVFKPNTFKYEDITCSG